jgi:hypothetical protein
MAVTVNYNNASPELGIYGAYNPFMVLINYTGATPFYLTYKIKVTALNNTTVVEKPISPTSGYFAQVNPLELIKEAFFKSEYNGTTEHSQPFSYSQIKIEVGASFSTAEANPPTFEGYTQSDTFYVYNGYELQPTVLNYRDPAWYDTFPSKLPKVKKTLYLLEDDKELLSFPSKIPDSTGTVLEAGDLITRYYDSSNSLVSTSIIDLTVRPDLTGTAYWNININYIFPATALYSKSKIRYDGGEGTQDSEEITIYRAECNPKQDRYRLYFINRYGGAEYENFTLAATTSYNIKKGKQIQSDGINYKATTFADIQNINNPNLQEFGNSTSKNITIRRDYFKTQEEVNSLAELFKSAVVIMFDAVNTAFPMIVETSNYDQDLISQNLYKVDVRLLYANNELQQIQ